MANRRDRRARERAAQIKARARNKLLAALPSGPIRATSGIAATIAAAKGDGDKKLGTWSGNAYTGAPMKPQGWQVPLVVDLAGVEVPKQHRPALRQHDHEQIVGHSDRVKVDKDGIHASGVFSGEKHHADKVVVPARNGFQWELSIGAEPDFSRMEFLDEGGRAHVPGSAGRNALRSEWFPAMEDYD